MKIQTAHSAQWGQLTGEVVLIDALDVRIRWDHSEPGTGNAHVGPRERGVTTSGLLYTRGEYDRNVAEGRFIVSPSTEDRVTELERLVATLAQRLDGIASTNNLWDGS